MDKDITFVPYAVEERRALAGLERVPSPRAVPVPASLAAGRALVAFQVAGNCMAPEVFDGDYAAVDLSSAPIAGDMVAAVDGGGHFLLKRLEYQGGAPVLKDNRGNEYSTIGLRLVGVVACVISTEPGRGNHHGHLS